MVLGTPVSHVDIIHTADHANPHTSHTAYTVLAVTADGEVWVWTVDAVSGRFKCTVRTTIRPVLLSMRCRSNNNNNSYSTGYNSSTTGELLATNAATGVGKTSSVARSVSAGASIGGSSSNSSGSNSGVGDGSSSKLSSRNNNNNNVSIRVEQCALTAAGSIIIHVLSTSANNSNINNSSGSANASSASSAEGGDWQAFTFCPDAMVWTRLVDMRFVLSRYQYIVIYFNNISQCVCVL